MKRKVGILLPIFSLPNKYGIGSLGKEAYDFIDFLKKAKQDYWQLLPSNPTSYGDSPYQSFSCYAQNHYFIDLDLLVKDGLLKQKDLDNSNLINETNYIDYGNIFVNKNKVLQKAYRKRNLFKKEFKEFKKDNKSWLNDYALFMSLKSTFNYSSWDNFPDKYKYKDKKALSIYKKENYKQIDEIKFEQYLYNKQYQELLRYAHKNNIEIIGDMPIYVAYDSVDVWSNPTEFQLDKYLKPTEVAGVPPDYFSEDGQLWGNPLYNYSYMESNKYNWWYKRIKHQLSLFDLVRIDHFRGFSAYYSIPYGNTNAKIGKWVKGPGYDLFERINNEYKKPKIIAENLGQLDNKVSKLISKCKYPGMKILEFEMYSDESINKLKHHKVNNIIYPGTHDNNPFMSWFSEDASYVERSNVLKEFDLQGNETISDGLIRYCYSLPFRYVIISYQDVLGLTKEARLNTPGKQGDNWSYMFKIQDFNDLVANKLATIKEKYIK